MLRAVAISTLSLLLGGCTMQLSWNKFRLGHFDDSKTYNPDGSVTEVETTHGIKIQWFPD